MLAEFFISVEPGLDTTFLFLLCVQLQEPSRAILVPSSVSTGLEFNVPFESSDLVAKISLVLGSCPTQFVFPPTSHGASLVLWFIIKSGWDTEGVKV